MGKFIPLKNSISGRHINIPIFLPELACPNRCIYCNQFSITNRSHLPSESDIIEIIESHLRTANPNSDYIEVAFFGGNFTGLPSETQISYLSLVQPYIKAEKIKGIRISTRPDFITNAILHTLKSHHVETIELGVQSMNDEVLKLSGRGYTADKVREVSAMIKKMGFKLSLQMMTGLPGDTPEKSIETALEIVKCQADMTRIYPLIVLKDTALEKMYIDGKYKPQSLDESVELACNLYKIFNAANVKVLKMGLHPSNELNNNQGIVAGPYHPSFAELVHTAFWKEKLSIIVSDNTKEIEILVNPSHYTHLIGFKGVNKKWMADRFKRTRFIPDNSIPLNTIHVNYCQ